MIFKLENHEKSNYPVGFLYFNRSFPFAGGCEASERDVYVRPGGEGFNNGQGAEEARGVPLYEYGRHMPAGGRRVRDDSKKAAREIRRQVTALY